jgi:hypothetical protein
MQRFLTATLSLIVLLILASCNRQKEVLIDDNTAPPDYTIDDVVVESYINRSYISLLGRKPDPAETSSATSTLRQNNLSPANRESFLNTLLSLPEYFARQYDIGRSLYLNSVDTSAINDEIFVLDIVLNDPQYSAIWPQVEIEKDKLLKLLDIPDNLSNGNIDMPEMHRRMVHNLIYDEINMGTQNFVVSMYQNFLFRYPTAAELAAGELMVDGFVSTVFLQNGRNKEDFIALFLGSGDYYEGQVRDILTRYLFREPTSEELETLSVSYKTNGDYQAIIRTVLATDEYAGI